MSNQEWQLAARPEGLPKPADFKLVDIPEPKEEDLKDGEVLVELKVLSVDPYMRPRMDAGRSGYIPSFELNAPMGGAVVGQVTASKSDKFAVGSFATGFILFRKRQIVPAVGLTPAFDKVSLSYFLGTLGLTGLSSYLPIKHIGQPKEGETVFVSGAAGAVGMTAVQIFKMKGCKVIGCAGSDDKVELLKSLGAEAFNYKKVDDFTAKLKELAPDGINVYFDNVGGAMLEAVLNNIATHGRIIACGAISQYNLESPADAYPIRNLPTIIGKCVRMEGFIVTQWKDEFEETIKTLMGHVLKGELQVKETVLEGFEKMPEAMIGLLTGTNTGKMVVRV